MDNLKNILGKNYPCKECIVQSTCSKSPMDNSACDEFKEAIAKVVKNEIRLIKLRKYLKKNRYKEDENKD